MAFTERLQCDRENIQAVIQIHTERSVLDHLFKGPVRGGNHTDVEFNVMGSAQATDGSVLQYPQNLHLNFERQFPDFIQKQRATVGLFKDTGMLRLGIGKSAFFITEQLAFDNRLGEGRAVDADEGLALAA